MKNDVRVGYFTAQPSSIDPFHGFDPDSYTAITAVMTALRELAEKANFYPHLPQNGKE